jgi:FlaA1/EpsC-like NDP-sugar epimerase
MKGGWHMSQHAKPLEGKVILVTGGTGSMGKTFVRRALSGHDGTPKKVIVMSRDEGKQHYMRQDYLNNKVGTDEMIYKNFQRALEFQIGDVRRYEDVCGALHGVDIVVNAAALKQVPICEYYPEQAIMTNCQGASNIVRAIRDFKFPVETVVGVSTDKACKPVNVMGMTKALQERIFISGNVYAPHTRFVCVRYGNVLASRGSVVPLFHDQIQKGGPITITESSMTRFLLSLEQAVDTVLAAIQHGTPGELFVPRAPSANIVTLAKALIGNRDIEIKVTGIRPGEKLHEIMISEEEAPRAYRHGDYYVLQPMLPELCNPDTMKPSDLISEFSSKDHVLDARGTFKLLEKFNMLVPQDESPEKVELVG